MTRDAINRLVLTVAGVGLLSGSGAASPRELHDQLRNRVLESIGQVSDCCPAAVRAALERDPGFGPLLESYRRRALAAVRSHPEAQDAVQETLLKVWRGRPDVFLESHDDVLRYLKTATRRNLYTGIREAAQNRNGELAQQAWTKEGDPADVALSEDLLAALSARLDPRDFQVLEAYLDGRDSQRRIAGALGLSRYAVGQSTERIGKELRTLLSGSA